QATSFSGGPSRNVVILPKNSFTFRLLHNSDGMPNASPIANPYNVPCILSFIQYPPSLIRMSYIKYKLPPVDCQSGQIINKLEVSSGIAVWRFTSIFNNEYTVKD